VAATGRLTGGDGERRRGCRAAAVVLLGHLQQVQRRGKHGIAGNARWPGRWPARTTLPASSKYGERELERMSGRFLVMAWIFSGEKGGLL
jgi:hypothetical protein